MPLSNPDRRREYDRQRYLKTLCEHGKAKRFCVLCDGSGLCCHAKQKHTCRECKGSYRCEHDQIRRYCKECKGVALCDHLHVKYTCKHCNIGAYLAEIQRMQLYGQLRKISQTGGLRVTGQGYDAFLGCSMDHFIDFITKKLPDGVSLTDIEIDHIKPISRFELHDPVQFLECCHYTNLQPLTPQQNRAKRNLWDEEDEGFWREHILHNDQHNDLFFPRALLFIEKDPQ